MSVSETIGFFPSRPSRAGESILLCSFAAALAKHKGPVVCDYPDGAAFPAHLTDVGNLRLRAFSQAERSTQDPALTVMLPPTVEQFLQRSTKLSCRCWVGFSPTVEDIHHARRLTAKLVAAGVPRGNIRLILWNEKMPGGLPTAMIEKHLGRFQAVLPFDPALIAAAENQGRLVQDLRPKALLSTALTRLAADTWTWLRPNSGPGSNVGQDMDWTALERRVSARLWSRLDQGKSIEALSSQEISFQIDHALQAELSERPVKSLPEAPLAAFRQRLLDHVTGLGPIESLMRDPAIGEIMVNGPDAIFIERHGRIEPVPESFASEAQLRIVIDRIVGRMGKRVDLSSPLCDVRLPDGSRVNVVLPPLSLNGPVITVRRFKPLYQSMEDLLRAGTLTPEQSDRLRRAVEDRKNIVVAGNSGAGKTTLLNVLAGLIPAGERIVTLEDAAELQIRQPHVVRLETRGRNAEGIGQVSMADLVVNALRMRPDRLIVGECRGAEVVPMLQAMNTGHDGSLTTLHANSAEDALKRLESLVLLNAPEWPVEVVREQISAGLDVIVYMKRLGIERKLTEIIDVALVR